MFEEDCFKIVFVGSGSKGDKKNNLVRAYGENKFDRNRLPTLGVDIMTKNLEINGKKIKLVLVDTAGQEFFGKLRSTYYKGSSGAVIVFYKENFDSFKKVPKWLKECKKNISNDTPVILIGIRDGEEVTTEEANKLAEELQIEYFEYSEGSKEEINEIMNNFVKKIIASNN